MKRTLLVSAAVLMIAGAGATESQAPGRRAGEPQRQRIEPGDLPPQGREDALDPSDLDPDPRMFIGDYHAATPRTLFGNLSFRDILSPLQGADALHPTKRGATLREITAISFVTLASGRSAGGQAAAGDRFAFYTTGGSGTIVVGDKTYDLKEGASFVIRAGYDFKMTTASKEPLTFYVRSDAALPDRAPNDPFTVVNRFDGDRRLGIHWVHVQSGGPPGMSLITLAPHTFPHPHSHLNEELWMMVKGETVLSLGKHLYKMTPGQGVRIPPTGLTAHSNINMGDEPVQMLVAIANGRASEKDYAQLNGDAPTPENQPDVDMYMGSWREAQPRIAHGNLYFRDMLTPLHGTDALHPTRKGAVLVYAQAVSYAMLEPGATAHRIPGEMGRTQELYVVNSGTGTISSDGTEVPLHKGMSFIVTPELDYRLKAIGNTYMTFYVVTEKIPDDGVPNSSLKVVDSTGSPDQVHAWNDEEHSVLKQSDGLLQYKFINSARLKPNSLSRPYSVPYGGEEIWIATDSDIDLLIGKRLRKLVAGTAYSVPASGTTAAARLNLSEKPESFLYFAK